MGRSIARSQRSSAVERVAEPTPLQPGWREVVDSSANRGTGHWIARARETPDSVEQASYKEIMQGYGANAFRHQAAKTALEKTQHRLEAFWPKSRGIHPLELGS